MKKIGVVGVPGGWSSERLVKAVEEKTGFGMLIDMANVFVDVTAQRVFSGKTDLMTLDAIIIKKMGRDYGPDFLDRLNILDFLNKNGMPCFSQPSSISGVLNRLHCTTRLQLSGIPLPETTVVEGVDQAVETVRRYVCAVLKPLYTSKARGMIFLDSRKDDVEGELRHFQDNGNKLIYIQKFLTHPGKDLGVTFIGGEYLGTYARVGSKGSWNTTTASGGRYEKYEPSSEVIELAHKAQQPMGLDFTCVDVIESREGPKVLEVSAFGGFKGLWQSQGVDAAALYVDYVLKRISQ